MNCDLEGMLVFFCFYFVILLKYFLYEFYFFLVLYSDMDCFDSI